jgi:hypothetical protein
VLGKKSGADVSDPMDKQIPGTINWAFEIFRFIGLRDSAINKPPDHIPDDLREAFAEGSACLSIECWNAAGAMFRLCLDLATRPLLPAADSPNTPAAKVRRDLGLRLAWLFDNGLLPKQLQEFARNIREDGNDGAHAGTLKKEDAADLLDFTTAVLERLYSEPERLRLAEDRRKSRRAPPTAP